MAATSNPKEAAQLAYDQVVKARHRPECRIWFLFPHMLANLHQQKIGFHQTQEATHALIHKIPSAAARYGLCLLAELSILVDHGNDTALQDYYHHELPPGTEAVFSTNPQLLDLGNHLGFTTTSPRDLLPSQFRFPGARDREQLQVFDSYSHLRNLTILLHLGKITDAVYHSAIAAFIVYTTFSFNRSFEEDRDLEKSAYPNILRRLYHDTLVYSPQASPLQCTDTLSLLQCESYFIPDRNSHPGSHWWWLTGDRQAVHRLKYFINQAKKEDLMLVRNKNTSACVYCLGDKSHTTPH